MSPRAPPTFEWLSQDNAQSSKTNDFLHPLPYVSVDEDATNIYGLLQDILKYCTLKKNVKASNTRYFYC